MEKVQSKPSDLTPGEAEELLESLYGTRRGKMGVCTRKMREIKSMMEGKADGQLSNVWKSFESFMRSMQEFNDVHHSVQELLSLEEKEKDQLEWFEPRNVDFKQFINETETWKRVAVEHQEQDKITHQDSISHTKSKGSRTSSVNSAHKIAAAEKAALQTRAAALGNKHALQLQEMELKSNMEKMDMEQKSKMEKMDMERKSKMEKMEFELKSKMEKFDLETDIAASAAKLKVLETDMDDGKPKDDMNAYLDEQLESRTDVEPEMSALEFVEIGTVPKTPLQRALDRRSSPGHIGRPTQSSTQDQLRAHLQSRAQNEPSTQDQSRAHIQSRAQNEPSRPTQDQSSTLNQSRAHNRNTNSTMNTGDITTGTRSQSDIADLIIMQQKLALLPAREITVFDGDPLTYQSFIRSFEYLVEDKTSSSHDRLYFLEQYTSGQPRDLVRSCLHMDSQQGYVEARRLIAKQFGNEAQITSAYLEKALNWTTIKADDGKGLHAYALYLRGCYNAMQELEYMDELDIPSNMRLMTSRLPYKLREKWRSAAYDTMQRTDRRARFQHLVEFMERQADILLDPLFGDLQQQESFTSRKVVPKTRTADLKQQSKSLRRSSFATTVSVVTEDASASHSLKQQLRDSPGACSATLSCVYCQHKHTLTDCSKFETQPQETKVEFLKVNGHCFGCLTKGHLSRDCKRKMTCRKCQRRHPTVLHIESQELSKLEPRQKVPPVEIKETSVSSTLVSAGEVTGAGKDCVLAIVPVRVKVAKGTESILTHAFLDPGSAATFCTENLMKRLKAKGHKTEILLQTMGQEKRVKSYELTGLKVGNLEGDMYLDLPTVYTQDKISVTKENMPTQKDLRKWPHLSGIQLNEIDADIELLIGINVPKALEPWHIINSEENGPYAVKTVLGWVVNGPVKSCTAMEGSGPTAVSANHISIANLGELSTRQYHQDLHGAGDEKRRNQNLHGAGKKKRRNQDLHEAGDNRRRKRKQDLHRAGGKKEKNGEMGHKCLWDENRCKWREEDRRKRKKVEHMRNSDNSVKCAAENKD